MVLVMDIHIIITVLGDIHIMVITLLIMIITHMVITDIMVMVAVVTTDVVATVFTATTMPPHQIKDRTIQVVFRIVRAQQATEPWTIRTTCQAPENRALIYHRIIQDQVL